MGLWGRRGNKAREKLRPSRSSSYSDDYRITPELAGIEGHKTGGGGGSVCDECYTRNRLECCPGNGTPCCSQDEGCCPSPPPPVPQQHHHPHRKHSPRRRRSASADTARVRGSSLGAMEVVVVDEGRRVDLRHHHHHQNFCTSCESCDTCDWTTHDTFSRVDLNNSSVHLFTAPLNTESTDSLSDHNSPPTPPPANLRSRVSPHRRKGSPKNRPERRGGEGEGGGRQQQQQQQQQNRPTDQNNHPRQQKRGAREQKKSSTSSSSSPRGSNNTQRSVAGHTRAPSAVRERVQRRLSRRESHNWQQHTGKSKIPI